MKNENEVRSPEIKTYHFNKEKNGILIEIGRIKNFLEFDFSDNPHCTSFYEILIFVKGNGHIFLNTQKVPLRDSQFIFISPYQKRRWHVNKEYIEGYFLIFEKDFLSEFFADKYFTYRLQYFYNSSVLPYFNTDTKLFFENDILQEMITEIKCLKNDSPHLLRSMLYYILIKLNREFSRFHNISDETHTNEIAIQFKNTLQKKVRHLQSVKEYSKLLGISRISLNHSVKKQFGTTATSMIKDHLIADIKDQLLFSNKTVAEISIYFNFSEPQHLNRLFKRLTDLTPVEFRSAYQNGNLL